MRPVFWLLLIVVVIVLIGFAGQNPSERVQLTLWSSTYQQVRLYHVVLVAFSAGALFTAVIGLIEGASDRLARRRLQRELTRTETENEMLRAQLASERSLDQSPATPALPQPVPPPVKSPAPESGPPPASAPVYDSEQSTMFPDRD